MGTKTTYLCPTNIEEDPANNPPKPCHNPLRGLLIEHNDSNMIDKSYMRYCDKCHSLYVLVPKWKETKFLDIPFLEDPYMGLDQMEVVAHGQEEAS